MRPPPKLQQPRTRRISTISNPLDARVEHSHGGSDHQKCLSSSDDDDDETPTTTNPLSPPFSRNTDNYTQAQCDRHSDFVGAAT